jgi:hypothetical protein
VAPSFELVQELLLRYGLNPGPGDLYGTNWHRIICGKGYDIDLRKIQSGFTRCGK